MQGAWFFLVLCNSLLLFQPLLIAANQLPRFQAYWESQLSYLYNDDELNNPWHIDLGNIDVGPLGYLGGPNVVTIDAADYCLGRACQEYFPDEFCSKYPPEGVPNKPRAVDDWGTKYNITSNMMTEGIKLIHERGGKVILAYGGTLTRSGIAAMSASSGEFAGDYARYTDWLVERIFKNIEDWDLDGVDFFFAGTYSDDLSGHGFNVAFHMMVIQKLRNLVGSSKTISYSTIRDPLYIYNMGHELAVIASCHTLLDYINIASYAFDSEAFECLERLGVPLSKVGILLTELPDVEKAQEAVKVVKEMGLSGINLFSINKENESYRGQFAKMVAEALYS